MSDNGISIKIFKFLKKQCILSFFSILTLIFGSLLVFDSKINPISLSFPEPPDLIGSLNVNERLTFAKILHFRHVKGCESMVKVGDYIYGTTQDGKIVKFNDTHVELFTKLNPSLCKTIQECGRPLGIRYDAANNRLMIVDAYFGLFEVDLITGKANRLFPKDNSGFKVTFFNDLDILPNGDVIISESSTKYQLHNMISMIFEGKPNGRVLRVKPSTGEFHILMDNLYFPNGVQLYKNDDETVLVVETLKLRVLAININPKSAISMRSKVFVDFLPGFPDNIRPSFSKQGYWINFASIRHSQNSFITDVIASSPFLKNSIKKLLSDSILHMLMRTSHGIVVRVDELGNLIESLHDTKGVNVSTSSETLEVGNHLYLGNYYLPFLVKINL